MCSIVKHVATGKRQRHFGVSKSDIEVIKMTFSQKHKIRYNPFVDTCWNDRWNDWFSCLT